MQNFSLNDNTYVLREIYQEGLYRKTFCTHINTVRKLFNINDMRKSHHKTDNLVINSLHFL